MSRAIGIGIDLKVSCWAGPDHGVGRDGRVLETMRFALFRYR